MQEIVLRLHQFLPKTQSVISRVHLGNLSPSELAGIRIGTVVSCNTTTAIANSDAKREQAEFTKKLMSAATYQLQTQPAFGKVTSTNHLRIETKKKTQWQ